LDSHSGKNKRREPTWVWLAGPQAHSFRLLYYSLLYTPLPEEKAKKLHGSKVRRFSQYTAIPHHSPQAGTLYLANDPSMHGSMDGQKTEETMVQYASLRQIER